MLLGSYGHSPTTDVRRRLLSNHDAVAVIVWSSVAITAREIIAALDDWHACGGRPKRDRRYLFNVSVYGGYGFVGTSWLSRSTIVARTVSRPSYCYVVIERERDTWHVRNDPADWSFHVRRTYWYRAAHGTYMPTLECWRRVAELIADGLELPT